MTDKPRKVVRDVQEPSTEAIRAVKDAIDRLALEVVEIDADLGALPMSRLEQTLNIVLIHITGVFQRRFKFPAEVDIVPGLKLGYRRSGNPHHADWDFKVIEGEKFRSLQFASPEHRTLAIDALPRLWEACEKKLEAERCRLEQDTTKARLFLARIKPPDPV